MDEDERRWMFGELHGGELPIACQYPYGVNGEGAPVGWTVSWISMKGDAPIDLHGNRIPAEEQRYSGLYDDTGALVATWDEGRWWTSGEIVEMASDHEPSLGLNGPTRRKP
jgi:hypothetical protein